MPGSVNAVDTEEEGEREAQTEAVAKAIDVAVGRASSAVAPGLPEESEVPTAEASERAVVAAAVAALATRVRLSGAPPQPPRPPLQGSEVPPPSPNPEDSVRNRWAGLELPEPAQEASAAALAAPAGEEEENGEFVVAAAVVEEEAAAADRAECSREVEELRTELAAAYQELGQWRLGTLKFVPHMIDVDGDSVMTAVVADRQPQAAGRKRPLEPSPAALTGLSQQQLLVRVKQEMAEVEKEKGEISRERNALDDQLTCVVCYTERREVLFNCSHLVCCAGCARKEVHCPSTGCNTLILWRHPVDLAEHAQDFGMAVGAA